MASGWLARFPLLVLLTCIFVGFTQGQDNSVVLSMAQQLTSSDAAVERCLIAFDAQYGLAMHWAGGPENRLDNLAMRRCVGRMALA
jgi:hypothetical protein